MDIQTASLAWLATLESKSSNTVRKYKTALDLFMRANKLTADFDVSQIKREHYNKVIRFLHAYAPASESLYIVGVTRFIEYLNFEHLCDLHPDEMKQMRRDRVRRPSPNLPQYPAKDLEKIIKVVSSTTGTLDELRDRALIITLADTGFRVGEIVKLRRGDIDWDEGYTVITGKGNKKAVVRFSMRSLQAMQEYLTARDERDQNKTKKTQTSQPVFSKINKMKQITDRTARNIVYKAAKTALGKNAHIWPHLFRHRFVTIAYKEKGLKMAQALARHARIETTNRYAHLSDEELDRGYREIFDKDQ